MKDDLKHRILVARGLAKADLVLKGGNLVNVFSGEIYKADVAIAGDRIAGIGSYDGKKSFDVSSRFVLPGLIDAHTHIESSLLAPAEYAGAVLPEGTTSVVADPHEIANVLGTSGIRSMLDATENLFVDFYFMLPSCVPASSLDTSGARLTAADLLPFLNQKRVIGLAEMMDYAGVLSGEKAVLQKLESFAHTLKDGHAPALRSRDLSAYAGTGISSDHECVSAEEAREKVRAGMMVIIRESSAAKNLRAILPAVTRENERFFSFGTDDLQPHDLRTGSISRIIKKAVRLGLDPVTAVRMATINPARHFNLRNKGAVAPGFIADIVVVDNLRNFAIEKVFKNGDLVARNGKGISRMTTASRLYAVNTIKAEAVSIEDIRFRARTGHARVMEIIPDQLETRQKIMPVIVDDGMIANDRDRDIAKIIVVERHKATGRIGIGLVRGFGLKAGAFASTVAHDSHNIIAVGLYDEDIIAAVNRIKKIGGGLVVVYKKKVLASLPLPVAGLMSLKPIETVLKEHDLVGKALSKLGVRLKSPFAVLSFLALPVIPDLKLTDRGLVDVKQSSYVDLFV